jgi:hypothetical protein
MVLVSVAAAMTVVATDVGKGQEAPPPSRRVLFFDLWKWDDWQHVELVPGEPRWIPEGTWTDPADPRRGVHSPTVWRDEASGTWRMVHSLKWSPFTLMAAQSEDGIAWRPLPVPDVEPEGGKLAPHHVFTLPEGAGGTAYVDPQATDGYRFRIFARQDGEPVRLRAAADPAHPWHGVVAAEGGDGKRYLTEAVTLVSRDGLRWELKTGGEWRWDLPGWHPEPPVFAFRDERRSRHGMTVRPGWGDRRQCLRWSRDLRTWTEPELLLQPDAQDTVGPVGFYGMPVHPVGNGAGFVGLLWVFRNANSQPVDSFNQFFGTMEAELVSSYDGTRFFRGPRTPFLRRRPIPEPGCTQIRPSSIVETPDEIRIYSEGHRGEHGRERAEQERAGELPLGSLLLHTLRPDGWMRLRPTGDWGRIQSKPFVLFTPEIRVNADASFGELRFQVTDERSQPLPGLGFEEGEPIRGRDARDVPLRWKEADLTGAVGRPVRLEIRLRNAELYALAMSHHFLDAQDSWLLKDGRGIDPSWFDF